MFGAYLKVGSPNLDDQTNLQHIVAIIPQRESLRPGGEKYELIALKG